MSREPLAACTQRLDVRDEPFAGVSPFITIYDQKKALDSVFTLTGGRPTVEEYQRDILVTDGTTLSTHCVKAGNFRLTLTAGWC